MTNEHHNNTWRETFARAKRAYVAGALSRVEGDAILKRLGFGRRDPESRNLELLEWARLREDQRRRDGKPI